MDIEEQIKKITDSGIKKVLSLGLAELYRQKPEFPVNFLGYWLKQYSNSKKNNSQITEKKIVNLKRFQQFEQCRKKQAQMQQELQHKQQESRKTVDNEYEDRLNKEKHLENLLEEWLPQYLQKNNKLTGVYVGHLDYRKRTVEENNFQLGAQNDTQNPKIIKYIGASCSHSSLMKGKVLQNQQGRSYEVFEEVSQQNAQNEEGDQNSPKQKKKTYIYVDNVLNEPKLHYFKYPRLGAFACFPLKAKGYLSINSFDKGVVDYKNYLKTKEEAEKQYQERLTEAKNQLQQAQKKCQDFDLNEEDPTSVQQKKLLDEEGQQMELKVKEIQNNPPLVEEVVFEFVNQEYFVACDTLGQDRTIQNQVLILIEKKLKKFIEKWQTKEKQMLLADILAFLEEEPNLQALENQYLEHQRNIISNNEGQVKEQYQNRQKQGQFQLAIIKCQKLKQLFEDTAFATSMQVYLHYNIPKYTEIVQIWCMLLGLDKKQINLPESNQLDSRKIITKEFFDRLFKKLQQYELKRQSSPAVPVEYKITKLLERLEKIDLQAVAKYNGFLLLLVNLLKNYCWARIFCRDARKEEFQFKQKLKEDRAAQIIKWEQDLQKALQTYKAQLDEEGLQNFKEQDWMDGYYSENPTPKPLEEPVYFEHQDIE